MAQAAEQHGLVDELTRHFAPSTASLHPRPARDRRAPSLRLVPAPDLASERTPDIAEALGALSRAIETVNRQLAFVVAWAEEQA